MRYRLTILLCLAVIRGWIDGLGYQHPDDPAIFAVAARRLVSGNWTETFVDERVQLGPLGVAFHYPVTVMTRAFDWVPTFSLSLLAGVCFTMGAVLVFRRMMADTGRRSDGLEMFVGLAILAGGPAWAASTSGHPEEGFVALLWLAAAGSAIKGRSTRAGVLIGIATGLKLSGALGLPLLLLDDDVRRSVKGMVVASVTGAVFYAPFLLFGQMEMFSFLWKVKPHSPLIFIGLGDEAFTWQMRVVQTLVVVGAASVLAARYKRSASVWLLPLGIFALRLLTDPLDYHYYWLAGGTFLLLGLSTVLPHEFSWHRLGVGALFYLSIVPFFVLSDRLLAGYLVIVSLGLLVLILGWPERPSHFNPDSASPGREIR